MNTVPLRTTVKVLLEKIPGATDPPDPNSRLAHLEKNGAVPRAHALTTVGREGTLPNEEQILSMRFPDSPASQEPNPAPPEDPTKSS